MTNPSGSNPASLTRRNSLAERSLVNSGFLPAPPRISVRRCLAADGRPSCEPWTYGIIVAPIRVDSGWVRRWAIGRFHYGREPFTRQLHYCGIDVLAPL